MMGTCVRECVPEHCIRASYDTTLEYFRVVRKDGLVKDMPRTNDCDDCNQKRSTYRVRILAYHLSRKKSVRVSTASPFVLHPGYHHLVFLPIPRRIPIDALMET